MDLYKTIGELRARRDQLERIIVQLEEIQTGATDGTPTTITGRRRGRKSMGAKERAEVSRRMKNYWANRARQQKAGVA